MDRLCDRPNGQVDLYPLYRSDRQLGLLGGTALLPDPCGFNDFRSDYHYSTFTGDAAGTNRLLSDFNLAASGGYFAGNVRHRAITKPQLSSVDLEPSGDSIRAGLVSI